MDLTRSVVYRGLDINLVNRGGATLLTYGGDFVTYGGSGVTYGAGTAIGSPAFGCMTETADISDIPLAEFAERVRVHDGFNVLEAYKANWVVHLSGSLFGKTRGDLFDRLQNLRRVMAPDTALRDSPGTKGFLPLTYYEPHTASAPVLKTLQCRPMGLQWKADEGTAAKVPGREDYTALALRWTVDLLVYQGPIRTIPGDNPDNPIDWPPGSGGEAPPVIPTCVDGGVTYQYMAGKTEGGLGPMHTKPVGLDTRFYIWTTDSLSYWGAGSGPSAYLAPPEERDMGNCGVCQCCFSIGDTDYFCGGIAGHVGIVGAGPGTLTVRTAVHPGGLVSSCGAVSAPGYFNATVIGTGVILGSAVPTIGVPATLTVAPTWEDAYHVTHPTCLWVADLGFMTGPWGFVSYTWSPTY